MIYAGMLITGTTVANSDLTARLLSEFLQEVDMECFGETWARILLHIMDYAAVGCNMILNLPGLYGIMSHLYPILKDGRNALMMHS